MIPTLCETAVCAVLMFSGAVEAVTAVPPINDMPLSITSYWFFGPDGEPIPWQGQADGNPEAYANTEPTSPSHANKVAACIQDWTLFYWTTAVSFTWQGQEMQVACYDNFGLESYRQPFYHDGYGEWVVPLDVLSPYPMHDLVWDWYTEMVKVGD